MSRTKPDEVKVCQDPWKTKCQTPWNHDAKVRQGQHWHHCHGYRTSLGKLGYCIFDLYLFSDLILLNEIDIRKWIVVLISLFMTYFEHESNVSCCPNCPVKVEICYIVPARYLRMILMILMMIRMKNTGSRLLMHHKGFWNLKLNHLDLVRFVFPFYLTMFEQKTKTYL